MSKVNMKHCRFENTFYALEECYDDLENEGVEYLQKNASEYEQKYIKRLIDLCKKIADEFGEE